MIFYKLGENLKAITCYENEIQITPLNNQAYNNLGIVFYNLGEIHKARSSFEKAIQRLNPKKIKSCKTSVVFDKRVSNDLLSYLYSCFFLF